MGYFQVRYNSIVVNYDRRGFIRLATGSSPKHTINAFIIYSQICAIFVLWKERKQTKRGRVRPIFKKNADAKKAKYVVEGSNCFISCKCSNIGICLFLLFSHSNLNLNYKGRCWDWDSNPEPQVEVADDSTELCQSPKWFTSCLHHLTL